MNYELAKRLKDSGFPQGHPKDHHLGGTWITQGGDVTYHETGSADECYVPTLEELIEACPKHKRQDDDLGWVFELTAREDGTWIAGYIDDKYGEMAVEMEDGATPTEAVAKLWLSLNKKV